VTVMRRPIGRVSLALGLAGVLVSTVTACGSGSASTSASVTAGATAAVTARRQFARWRRRSTNAFRPRGSRSRRSAPGLLNSGLLGRDRRRPSTPVRARVGGKASASATLIQRCRLLSRPAGSSYRPGGPELFQGPKVPPRSPDDHWVTSERRRSRCGGEDQGCRSCCGTQRR
jgi:hypothetical protein